MHYEIIKVKFTAFHYNGNSMGSITKLTTNSFKDGEVKTDNINDGVITNAKIINDVADFR